MKTNLGFEAATIKNFSTKLKGKLFLELDEEESSDEFRHFQFVGFHEGEQVIFDTILYTLRFQHELELYEMAEHEAAKHFPNYRKLQYQEDENGNLKALDNDEEAIGLYMAEVILDLQEEEVVKVKEHIDYDMNVDFGVGLDIGLHREAITDQVIEDFITQFNKGSVQLDATLYTFHQEEESEA